MKGATLPRAVMKTGGGMVCEWLDPDHNRHVEHFSNDELSGTGIKAVRRMLAGGARVPPGSSVVARQKLIADIRGALEKPKFVERTASVVDLMIPDVLAVISSFTVASNEVIHAIQTAINVEIRNVLAEGDFHIELSDSAPGFTLYIAETNGYVVFPLSKINLYLARDESPDDQVRAAQAFIGRLEAAISAIQQGSSSEKTVTRF